MRNLLKCSAVLLLFSLSLVAQSAAPAPANDTTIAAPPGAPSPELVDTYFKRMFGYDPGLQVKVLKISQSPIADLFDVTVAFLTPESQQVGHWFVSRDLKHAVAGDMLNFGADPFAVERAELRKSAFGATKGAADAKLLIVEFADLECPACREFAPIATKLRNDFPDARFVFQSFPLSQIHPWAQRAAAYMDCIARENNDRAFTFIDAVYSHQKEIESEVRKTDPTGKTSVDDRAVNEQLRKYTEWAGADPAKTQACADQPATTERIARSLELGKSLGVTSTPTLFINGRHVGTPNAAQYDQLKAVTTYEAEQATAGK